VKKLGNNLYYFIIQRKILSTFFRLAQSQIEEYIVKENFKGEEDYYFTFEEFIQRLKIAADNVSYTLFRQFISKSDIADVIDFKEYLFHALFLIKLAEPKIELVKTLFMVSFIKIIIILFLNSF
jgi:hypothetical protein